MLFDIQVVNKTSGLTTCCQLKAMGLQAFVCPKIDVGDHLEIVLEETDCLSRSVLAEFVVPGPCEHEDKSKCLTMKRVCNREFELIVEFTRNRINSRNKKDLEWKLSQCALHLKNTPPVLQEIAQYMQATKVLDQVKSTRDAAQVALDQALAEEQRLLLAMLDAKHIVMESRKELEEAERLYEEEIKKLAVYETLVKQPTILSLL
jgi:hypothetical protein